MKMVIDTGKRNKKIAEGTYRLKITQPPEAKLTKSGNEYFRIEFEAEADSKVFKHSQVFFGDELGELCEVLGAEKNGDDSTEYVLDDSIIGRPFQAEIYHEADRKDPTKIHSRMRKYVSLPIQTELPFPEKSDF